MQKFHKSKENKKIFGVCGGLAETLNCDPTLIRIIWACSFFIWGIGGIAYLLAALIMPYEEDAND